MDGLVAPAHSSSVLPPASDVVAEVPEVVGQVSLAKTAAPATGVIDGVVTEVPVVRDLVPADTATSVTQPVLVHVDTAVAPVTSTAEKAIAPVAEAVVPVVEVVDPVVEAVSPVVEPVVDTVRPVTDPVIEVVPPVVKPVVQPAPDQVTDLAPAVLELVEVGASETPSTAPRTAAKATESAKTLSQDVRGKPSTAAAASRVEPAVVNTGFASVAAGGYYALPETPSIVLDGLTSVGSSHSSVVGADAGAAASISAGAGSGVLAADVSGLLSLDASSSAGQVAADQADLPLEPAFDLGSTPD